jgi:ubiquitin-conjugating enzyme E2 S
MASRENLNPQALIRIAKEVQKMVSEPQTGIRLIVNEKDLTDIQADIEGPTGTPYEGGVFRCKLVIGSEFPAAPPRGLFLTKIFHPNVSGTGDICVNTLKKDWSPDLGFMHILQVIRCLLIIPFPESALNEEASRLFLESYDEYARRAALMTSIHATQPVRSKSPEGTAGSSSSSSLPATSSSAPSSGSSSSLTAPEAGKTGLSAHGTDEQGQVATKVAKTMPQKKSSRSALKRL